MYNIKKLKIAIGHKMAQSVKADFTYFTVEQLLVPWLLMFLGLFKIGFIGLSFLFFLIN